MTSMPASICFPTTSAMAFSAAAASSAFFEPGDSCSASRRSTTSCGRGRLPVWVVRILRSEEHTSELQSLMRISYAVFCLKKKNETRQGHHVERIKTHIHTNNKNKTSDTVEVQ